MCIDMNGDPYQVMEFLHVKPGKGAAFVRTKLRNLNNGRVLENTFPAGSKLTEVRIETREYQYLYTDGEAFHFMNNDDYNQVEIQKDLINAPNFLKEGMNCKVMFHADEDRPLSVELPLTYTYEIIAKPDRVIREKWGLIRSRNEAFNQYSNKVMQFEIDILAERRPDSSDDV